MKNRKTYIIADFVKTLGVARTTLKDWMTRYEEYIEFEVRGHRKIYFDSSLDVLKEIAEMRGNGKTASEIMIELSDKHPVNVDVAHEIEAPEIEVSKIEIPKTEQKHFPVKNNPLVEVVLPIVKQQNEEMERMLTGKLHDMASNLHEAQLASLLPIVKRQNEKMERMLTGKLHDMASNLHRNQLDSNNISKQSSRRLLLVIALILTLVVTVVLTSSNIYYVLMHQKEDLRSVEKSLEKTIARSKELFVSELQKRAKADEEQKLKLQNLATMLERNKKNSHQDIASLQNDLKEQQKTFKVMLDKYNKLMTEQRKDVTSLLKGTFDKERGVVVGKIDELIKQSLRDKHSDGKENMQILELKQALFDLREKMEILKREKEKAEKSAMPASFFPNPNKSTARPVAKK